MAELKRSIKCTNCSSETNVYFSSDLNIHELLLHGKCARCGNSLQLNYSLVDQSQAAQQGSSQSSSSSSDGALPNLDQSIFGPTESMESELPSDAIKELIED